MPEATTIQTGASDSSFSALFEATPDGAQSSDTGAEGQIVSGLIVQVTHDAVVVDIGGTSEGVIPRSEFVDARGDVKVQAGGLMTAGESDPIVMVNAMIFVRVP